MYILGYDIDIYTVIIVLAGIFVFGIILMMISSMRSKKHDSKKENRKHSELRKMPQSKYEKQPQVKPLQDQQATVTEGSNKEFSVKPTQEFQDNPSPQQIQSSTDVAQKPVTLQKSQDDSKPQITSSTEAAKSPPEKIEDDTKDKEPKEQIEESNGLDDIFSDSDEPEDPMLSELANDLTDVNLDTLNKLGKEVSQVLSKSAHDMKRGRSYD
jgi:FtsZ-interacting cell division protein ZipA